MNNSLATPERISSVKRRYGGRVKRKRDAPDNSNEDSPDESGCAEEHHGGTKGGTPLTPLKDPVFIKRSPKKVEGHLPGPGPSPKRFRRDMDDTTMQPPSGKATQSLHSRNNSSLGSIRLDRTSMSSPRPLSSSGRKDARPQSLKSIGPLTYRHPMTSDMDDSVSAVESSPGSARVRRTEAERLQFLKDDAHCGEMEPHRVFCTRCDKWVNLGKQQTYALRPWEKHRSRCDQQQSGEIPRHRVTLGSAEEDDDDDNASAAASSIALSERSVRRSEPERRACLELDPNAETIEVERVLCKVCHKWVKLSTKQRYALYNWQAHQRRCTGATPSSRVATAERKLKLVNDPQAMSSSARSVECLSCRGYISLGREGEYNLTKWNEHKLRCPSTSVSPSTGRSRPSASIASTEATAVASDRSPPRQGRKRAREVEDEDDVRPHNRPRTEAYEAIRKDAPGPWGWFLMPFQAFVRGFREGMGGSSSG